MLSSPRRRSGRWGAGAAVRQETVLEKVTKKGLLEEPLREGPSLCVSDESVDGVVDVVVGDDARVTGDAVVGLDVLEGLDVPGG